ncbi:T cell receptor delta constant isoform X1 [Acipenser oxyrinchus oxyrinchus]|nr:T cell receptor delta constant isoform X1 [Acipenser oxyrinchus oxyrinchus]
MEFNKVYGTTEKLIFGSGTTLTVLPKSSVNYNDPTTPLIFGSGTKLSVQPKNTAPREPSLSVFTPPKERDTAVCVATGFLPKDLDISMSVGNGAPNIIASNDKAVLSLTDKTYNFAAFLTVGEGNNQEVTCKAKGQTATSFKKNESADNAAPTAPALNCEKNGTSTDQKGVTIESIHLNFNLDVLRSGTEIQITGKHRWSCWKLKSL